MGANMGHKKTIINFILFLFFIYLPVAFSYDDEITHAGITEKAIFISNIEPMLQGLGFAAGVNSKIPADTGKSILFWLRKGSIDEDSPLCRASNHFHNPLKSWDQAYMSDDTTFWGSIVREHCNSEGWPYSDRKSSLTWATGYLSPSSLPVSRNRQEMGWDHARQYYYSALTALSRADQESFYVKTFRALGQALHLLQDMAVPAHVRNDFTAHLIFQGFEGLNFINWYGNPFEYFVKNHAGVVCASQAVFPDFTSPGVTDFWDTDLYAGGNFPSGLPVGLAELTHARYFSDSTIPNHAPRPDHSFPLPFLSGAGYQVCEDYAEDLSEIKKYVSRREKGPCPPLSEERMADHFAAVSLRETPLLTEENLHLLRLELDDNVHRTYAKELIPQAIGYSAKLLDYFFRGKLQVTAVPIFYRDSLHYMRLKIKNLADEAMSGGAFALTYRYMPPGGDPGGAGDLFRAAWGLDGSGLVPCVELGSQQEMTVDFRMDPPLAKSEYEVLKFVLAYRGKLGKEDRAVIGKVFSPGRVVFEEEWDRPLPGSYVWAHTGFNWDSYNPGGGASTNEIAGDVLIKENVRYAGGEWARVNESFLGDGAFRVPFPLAVTPNTYVMYKIDEMVMDPLNGAGGVVGHQFLMLSFTDLLTLMVSQEGQMEWWNPTTAYYTFVPGQIVVDNIYESFQRAGISIPEPFVVNFLGLAQRWHQLESAAPRDQVQRMKVDFIRIVEGNVE
jgi:hypothetical protein